MPEKLAYNPHIVRDQSDKTILIIDDEQAIVDLLSTILGIYGYNCVCCLDSSEATELAVQIRPDLILLDIAMPDKDGYQVCSELKHREETKNTPVFMLTALALNQDKKLALQCGADAFLFKPFEHDEIVSKVRALLN